MSRAGCLAELIDSARLESAHLTSKDESLSCGAVVAVSGYLSWRGRSWEGPVCMNLLGWFEAVEMLTHEAIQTQKADELMPTLEEGNTL